MDANSCPKCGFSLLSKNPTTGVSKWHCGTVGPDNKGKYHTSLLCEHTVAMKILREADAAIYAMYTNAARKEDHAVTGFLQPYRDMLDEFLWREKNEQTNDI